MDTHSEREAREIAKGIWVEYQDRRRFVVAPALEDYFVIAVSQAFQSAESRGFERCREKAIYVASNVACNANAKYTCCLENGLNASAIIIKAIKELTPDE